MIIRISKFQTNHQKVYHHMSSGPSSGSTIKDLSSILKTYLSPIRFNSSSHINPDDVIAKSEILVNQLNQLDSSSTSTSDQIIHEKTVKGLLSSLLELVQHHQPTSDLELHRFSSTILVVLEPLYTDLRSRRLVVQKFHFHLLEFWWDSILRPSLVSFPSQLHPPARSALVNLLSVELGSQLGSASHRLADDLFEAYCINQPDQVACEDLVRSILVKWGKASTKEFFNFIELKIISSSNDDSRNFNSPSEPNRSTDQAILLSTSDHPLAALTLLVDFITSSPYSIHHVLSTSLVDTLIESIIGLEPSVSTARLELLIETVLLIFPRIPICFESFLIRLFLAYARSICWAIPSSPLALLPPPHHLSPSGLSSSSVTEGFGLESSLLKFFSLLYGLFPCHFLDFLRTPLEFLQNFHLNSNPTSTLNVEVEQAYRLIDTQLLKRQTIV